MLYPTNVQNRDLLGFRTQFLVEEKKYCVDSFNCVSSVVSTLMRMAPNKIVSPKIAFMYIKVGMI